MASWSEDRTVRLWDLEGGADGTVHIWDAASVKPRASLAGHAGRDAKVAISPDGAFIASVGTDDATLRVWQAPTGPLSAAMRVDVMSLDGCPWLPDGTGVAVTGDGGCYVYTFNRLSW